MSKKALRKSIVVTSEHFRPELKDCDLCTSRVVWCNRFTCGDSNMEIFVCTNCQLGGKLNECAVVR